MEKHILKHLNSLVAKNNLKNVYVIEYKGKRLTMSSKKSSWATLSAAKNAIRHEIPTFYYECPDTWRTRLDVIKNLEEREIIKYILL